jgi:hypothetical protein
MIQVAASLNNITKIINGNGQHITGSISQEAGAIWSFTFEILPNNVGYDLIRSRKTQIKAINTLTGRTEFAGRVLLPKSDMDNKGLVKKSVTCESYLGYLQDSVQPYKEEELYTPEEFIDLVLSNHNEQVDEEKRIYRGKVTVDVADTGNVYKGLQYETSYQTLKSKLVDVYGGELEIEEINGVLYLNYLKQIGVTRATKIKLGRNMQQASREINPLNIITRVIPLGAKLKITVTDENGNTTEQETEERLTLKGYTTPEGATLTVPWLDDTEKQKELGIIVGTLDLTDVTDQSNLYTKTKTWLTKNNFLELSHTLTALDLKEIGQDIDSLNCCDSYPVENELIGLDEVLRITKKNIDINAPYKSSITIGEKKTTFSKLQASKVEKLNIELQQLTGIVQNLGNASGVISTQVATLSTSLTQTINEIVSEALASYVTTSELETVKEEISSSVTQTAEDITIAFNNEITKTTEDINGYISSEFTELHSYIRYYMDDLGKPVIELGSSNSDIILKIKNDRIAFEENGIEVAYISDNQLYITNASILNELRIGNMAFKRRANGNLSLVMIGG